LRREDRQAKTFQCALVAADALVMYRAGKLVDSNHKAGCALLRLLDPWVLKLKGNHATGVNIGRPSGGSETDLAGAVPPLCWERNQNLPCFARHAYARTSRAPLIRKADHPQLLPGRDVTQKSALR